VSRRLLKTWLAFWRSGVSGSWVRGGWRGRIHSSKRGRSTSSRNRLWMAADCTQSTRVQKPKSAGRQAVGHAIFTIGYQERTVVDFVKALRSARIRVVVDIRAVPLSRRAEFRKSALASLLDDAGIEYIGIPGLGAPKELRDRLKFDGDYAAFFADFRAHMITRRTDLRALIGIARAKRSALLCFEREAQNCHRSVVARYVSNKLGCLTDDL
jgi:hypothetical protein